MQGVVFRTALPRLLAGVACARLTGRPATFAGGPLALVTLPDVELPGERWVRVRTRLGGICGTDLHLMKLEVSRRSSVLASRRRERGRLLFLGHEAVGEVVELGAGVRGLAKSQRVVLIPGSSCRSLDREPACSLCQAGHVALCAHRDERPTEIPLGGGWSEQFLRHDTQLFSLPDEVPDEAAVLFEPVACSLHAVLRHPPATGDHVLVLGGGTIGLGVVASLRALGVPVRITVLARHQFQAEHAIRLGADKVVAGSGGRAYQDLASVLGTSVLGRHSRNQQLRDGFAVVYDCVGSAATLHDSLRWCRPRGTVVLIGVDVIPGVLDRSPIWHREIDVLGSMSFGVDTWEGRRCTTFERVGEWCSTGRLPLADLLTHRFPLREYRQAILASAGKTGSHAVKVAFEFRSR